MRSLLWPVLVLVTALILSRIEHGRRRFRDGEADSQAHTDPGEDASRVKPPPEIRGVGSVSGERRGGRGTSGQERGGSAVERLLDDRLPAAVRLDAFRQCMIRRDSAALGALRRFFRQAPASLQLQALEILARSEFPKEKRRTILDWAARHGAPAAGVVAVRFLGTGESPAPVQVLGAILGDENVASAVRAEAARVLGEQKTEEAFDFLTRRLAVEKDEAVFEGIVEGLALYRFRRVRPLFENLLSDETVPDDLREAGIEALADSSDPEAASFLVECLAQADAGVREAAAWALSAFDGQIPESATQEVLAHLGRESSARVRAYLYEMLAGVLDPAQRETLEGVIRRVSSEPDATARLAGWGALAAQFSEAPEVRAELEQFALPEATRVAADENADVHERLQALLILRNIGGDAAVETLRRLTQSASPQVARAAQSAIERLSGR